jgi:hypothetical protein
MTPDVRVGRDGISSAISGAIGSAQFWIAGGDEDLACVVPSVTFRDSRGDADVLDAAPVGALTVLRLAPYLAGTEAVQLKVVGQLLGLPSGKVAMTRDGALRSS